MPKHSITRYAVDELVQARKFAGRTKQNTLDAHDPKQGELCLKVDIRRVDSPSIDLTLEFYGRVMKRGLTGVASTQYPSASLLWHGKRIRGVDYKIKHEVVEGGIVVGVIKGWHEHYWTDLDEDEAIRELNPPLRNYDLKAVIAWCSEQWNIEGIAVMGSLFDE